jgi:hypothetical protein
MFGELAQCARALSTSAMAKNGSVHEAVRKIRDPHAGASSHVAARIIQSLMNRVR